MALIIVESPTKARTFNRILKGKEFFVFATMGHFRDLPSNTMSIQFDKDFKPNYEVIKGKQKVVDQLKKLASENNEVIFATDPDREGESISYHAAQVLGLINENWPNIQYLDDKPVKRIVFHEITSHALEEALAHPTEIRIDLVKAQQARRILDRIVGYQLSPLLWKKMNKNWLSAGRVQTVALRLIVEREKEIASFELGDYFQIKGTFKYDNEFLAQLTKKDGVSYEIKTTVPLFTGDYTYTKTSITKESVDEIVSEIQSDSFKISDVSEEVKKRYPPPPYTTSLLQQDVFQKCSYTPKMTMRIAQDLYESGFISYHRTDSFNLSSQFVFRAMKYIEDRFGKEYALEKPRGYKTKSKMAQEAHEAIRPTKLERLPEELTLDKKITQNHKKVYTMIYNRALATQMKEAEVKHTKVTLLSTKGYEFEAEVQKVLFDGFLKIAQPDLIQKQQNELPLKVGVSVTLTNLESIASQTKPPPRFNEASIIRILEEKGIGRPSTYAPIITLIQEKNYIEKENRYFKPTNLGTGISDYLSKGFPNLFDLNFTAQMEDSLDEIAEGQKNLVDVLRNFYTPFEKVLKEQQGDTGTIEIDESLDEKCDKCGNALIVRYSKFGKFMACSKFPECKFTKSFLTYVNNKFCPMDNGRMVLRYSRNKKRFYGCEHYPTCRFTIWALADLNNPEAVAKAIEMAKVSALAPPVTKPIVDSTKVEAKKVVKKKKAVKRTEAKKVVTKKTVKS
ncbi:MAG: type I DNA topoisomerase [Candidatus Roizmanbacteria bacterium]